MGQGQVVSGQLKVTQPMSESAIQKIEPNIKLERLVNTQPGDRLAVRQTPKCKENFIPVATRCSLVAEKKLQKSSNLTHLSSQ